MLKDFKFDYVPTDMPAKPLFFNSPLSTKAALGFASKQNNETMKSEKNKTKKLVQYKHTDRQITMWQMTNLFEHEPKSATGRRTWWFVLSLLYGQKCKL